MKTNLLFSALICALFFVTSCSKDTSIDPINQNDKTEDPIDLPKVKTKNGGDMPLLTKPDNEVIKADLPKIKTKNGGDMPVLTKPDNEVIKADLPKIKTKSGSHLPIHTDSNNL